jgi:hypothetical protein
MNRKSPNGRPTVHLIKLTEPARVFTRKRICTESREISESSLVKLK